MIPTPLESIARALVAPGHILAADESHPTIAKRFSSIGIENTEETLITEGLDGLRERLAEYRGLGARFAKWRAVLTIGPGIPGPYCLGANAPALARYAALAQEAGLVPIVEPEVLMDGDHPIERCAKVTEAALHTVFAELHRQRVVLEAMLLKPNMILPGTSCPRPASAQEVAETTIRSLRRVVPAAVPGIVFLSGGQNDSDATAHLTR
jgi:fructose-bisphosphate aldolase, class I